MATKRAPSVTAKSLKGEMKVNKVFGTDKKPSPKKKYPTLKKKFNAAAYTRAKKKAFGM